MQITDTLNQFIAYSETYTSIEDVLVGENAVIAIVKNLKG